MRQTSLKADGVPTAPPKPKQTLRQYLGFRFPSTPLVPGLSRYLMLRRVPFALWVHARRWRYTLWNRLATRASAIGTGASEQIDEHNKKHVVPHNASQIAHITRHRTERMINVLRTLASVKPQTIDLLCIGPRNEAEVLLFRLYGFLPSRIKAIDLFSYSPLIEVMDMHQMRYPDDSFDVVYSSYVLRYSNDIRRACMEKVRILRDGGLVVAAFVNGPKYDIVGSELTGGIKELLSYFGEHVLHVYWHEEHPTEPGCKMCTVIFSIRKSPA